MAYTLEQLTHDDGPPIFYREDFRRVIEDHLPQLRTGPKSYVLNVDAQLAYQFEFNLFGLLRYYRIQPYLFWITMRVNNYYAPEKFLSTHHSLIIPDTDLIEKLRSTHSTVNATV